MAKIVSDFYNHPKNQNPQKGLTKLINEIVSSFLNKQKLSKGKRFHTSQKYDCKHGAVSQVQML